MGIISGRMSVGGANKDVSKLANFLSAGKSSGSSSSGSNLFNKKIDIGSGSMGSIVTAPNLKKVGGLISTTSLSNTMNSKDLTNISKSALSSMSIEAGVLGAAMGVKNAIGDVLFGDCNGANASNYLDMLAFDLAFALAGSNKCSPGLVSTISDMLHGDIGIDKIGELVSDFAPIVPVGNIGKFIGDINKHKVNINLGSNKNQFGLTNLVGKSGLNKSRSQSSSFDLIKGATNPITYSNNGGTLDRSKSYSNGVVDTIASNHAVSRVPVINISINPSNNTSDTFGSLVHSLF